MEAAEPGKMKVGKTVAGGLLLAGAAVLYLMGQAPLAMPVAGVGASLVSVGLGHKLDRLIGILQNLGK